MDFSYSRGSGDIPLLDDTIGANLRRMAQAYSVRPALFDAQNEQRWNYAEFDSEVDRLARALISAGVEKGDRVGIWSTNCAEWVLLQYATARIGAVLVCINPAYRVHELTHALGWSGVSLLVSALRNRDADYRAMIDDARGSLSALRRVVYIGDPSWDELLAGADLTTLETLRHRAESLSPDDPINIQYTSGTTGMPKGATLTHRNILNNGFCVGELLEYTEFDRICLPVPFYHCFGMVMGNLAATSHGAMIVIPAPNFDPVATIRSIASERCTSLYGVPTMFIAMLATDESRILDLASLRTGIMAGAPCPVPVMRDVVSTLGMEQIAICYGMTETSPVSTMTRMDDNIRRRTETVGRVMPNLEVKIVDPATGLTVPRGVSGELCTRGYSVMLGYWNEPEKTVEAIDSDGWMHTGDLAIMDADDYVSIVGRIKDMIIRGGENIYPREIEEFLYTHPDISDVQIVGVPDKKYGEEVAAFIKIQAGASPPNVESINSFCRGRIARYKIPKYVLVVDDFPMTVTGKIRKDKLRDRAIELLYGGV